MLTRSDVERDRHVAALSLTETGLTAGVLSGGNRETGPLMENPTKMRTADTAEPRRDDAVAHLSHKETV